MTNESIRVTIVDDHLMFAESLARLLEDEVDITVRDVSSSGHESLSALGGVDAHVAIVDYHLPDIDGASLARAMLNVQPGLGVIMLTGANDDQLMLEAIQAGCAGFLTKDRAASEVADAVRSVAAGEALIPASTLARLLPLISRSESAPGADLTERERDILDKMALGLTNRNIAEETFLSVNTVRNYTQSILTKLGAHSKLEAVSLAVRLGVITYPHP